MKKKRFSVEQHRWPLAQRNSCEERLTDIEPRMAATTPAAPIFDPNSLAQLGVECHFLRDLIDVRILKELSVASDAAKNKSKPTIAIYASPKCCSSPQLKLYKGYFNVAWFVRASGPGNPVGNHLRQFVRSIADCRLEG